MDNTYAPLRESHYERVHSENGLWYFWNSLGTVRYGPYMTETIAREYIDQYYAYLYAYVQSMNNY